MSIYLVIPIILFVLTLQNPKNKYIEKLVFLCVGIFLCTSYFNGSDWRQYEPMYNAANWNSIMHFYAEKGFYIYMLLFKTLGFEFFQFFVITKFIVYYIFYKKICEYECNRYFVLSLFYVFIGLYLFIDCPFRNLIGISIIYVALSKLEKNKNIEFIILVLLAGSFHKSLLFLVCLILIKKYVKLINRMNSRSIILFLILIWGIFTFQDILLWLLFKLPLFSRRLSGYVGTKYSMGKIFSLGNIEKMGFVFLMIVLKKKIFVIKKDLYLFVYILLYFIFYRIALTFPILSRYVFCLQIFYIIGISKLLFNFSGRVRIGIISIFLLYQIVVLGKSLVNTYVYLPYTSYFKYIGKEKPSFEYRSKFNILIYNERVEKDKIIK